MMNVYFSATMILISETSENISGKYSDSQLVLVLVKQMMLWNCYWESMEIIEYTYHILHSRIIQNHVDFTWAWTQVFCGGPFGAEICTVELADPGGGFTLLAGSPSGEVF